MNALGNFAAIFKRLGMFALMVLTAGKSGKRAGAAWAYLFTGRR